VKVGDFHGYAAQLVHLVQIFISYSGYIVKGKAEAELGAENMLLTSKCFLNRAGLNRSQTIFTNDGIGHNNSLPENCALRQIRLILIVVFIL
jgi:hypothetical protein